MIFARKTSLSSRIVLRRVQRGIPNYPIPSIGTINDGVIYNFVSMPLTYASISSEKHRVWHKKEVNLTLDQKVKQFVDVRDGELHRLDLYLKSDDIITESCKLQTLKGMEQAENVLQRMLLEKRAVEGCLISAQPFEKIIYGWSKMGIPDAIEKMRDILNLMKLEHDHDLKNNKLNFLDGRPENDEKNISRSSCQPTTQTYNTVLKGMEAISKREPSAAFVAEKMLDEMLELYRTKNWQTKPNTRSFTHVIQAHGNTSLSAAGDRAEKILKSMQRMHIKEKEMYRNKFDEEYDMENPTFNNYKIVTPDTRVFSAVISAIAKSNAKDAAERASDMIKKILDSGTKVDVFAFNSVIDGFGRKSSMQRNPKHRYNSAKKAEALALLLLDQYNEICEVEEGKNAEDLESYWEKQLTIAFNIVLNAWARSDVKEAGQRADALWQKMLLDPLLQPDRISMNATIKAWARAFNPKRAEETLNFVLDIYESGQLDSKLKPDAISYSTVISAWAKSNDPEKTLNARRLLETMLAKYEAGDNGVKPNIVAFTAVLNAAGYSMQDKNQEDTFSVSGTYNIALQTYDEILDDKYDLGISPDSFVFAAMIKVIKAHTDELSAERRHMLQRVFDEACAAGQVSSLVITELRSASPDNDLLARLLGSEKLSNYIPSISVLPAEWIRNVPKHPRFRNLDENGRKQRKKR